MQLEADFSEVCLYKKRFLWQGDKKLSMQRGNRRQRLIGQDGKRDELIASSSLFY